ncbi:MAG: divalent metal cation transporter [Candidatus Obscuribacterales bacterium]|nr:divalent metal cation transporter [Candidatus Obscuribacterales bacterium]
MLTALTPEDKLISDQVFIDTRVTQARFPRVKKIKSILNSLGPGLVAGVSDDDPSGIATYSLAGAAFGFSTLWMAIFILPLLTAVQYICAKIGMVTGSGIGSVLREFYPKAVLYPAVIGLVIANSINAGADISAIASAVNLLVPVPVPFLTLVVAFSIVAFQVFGSYRLLARMFKWLTLALFAYVATAFFVKLDPVAIARATFVPTIEFNGEFLSMLLAILGTTLSPYLFFWQADQEVEEKIHHGKVTEFERRGCSVDELSARSWDVRIGMFVAIAGMYFIILVTGATLHHNGHTEILSATDAALALRPLAGPFAAALFAMGIIGTGFLAVPILTASCAYALAQVFDWKHGLHQPLNEAKEFYAIIVLSTLFGLSISYLGINPFVALYWAAVFNGLLAAPLLVLIMCIANNREVMGRHTNGFLTNVLGWSATAIMFAAIVGMCFTFHCT